MANEVTVHVKAKDHTDPTLDGIERKIRTTWSARLRKAFDGNGKSSGLAFMAGFIKTITFGQVGGGFAQAAVKMSPKAAGMGAALGVVMAGALIVTLTNLLTAGIPLLITGLLVALPFAHLVKTNKAAVDTLKAKWKGFIEYISTPLQLPFKDVLKEVGEGLDRLKGPFRTIMSAIAPALKPFTKGVMDGLVAFVVALKPAMPGIAAGMKEWGKQAPRIGEAFGKLISKIMEDPEAVVQAVEDLVDAIVQIAEVAGVVIGALQSIATAYGKFARKIDDWERQIDANGGPLGYMWEKVREMVPKIGGAIAGLSNRIGRWLLNIAIDAGRKGKELVTRHIEWIRTLPGKAREALSGLWGKISGAFILARNGAATKGKELVERHVSWIRGLPGRASRALSGLWGSIVGHFTRASTGARDKGRELVNRHIEWIRGLPGRASRAVSGLWRSISGHFTSAVNGVRQRGADLVNRFVQFMRSLPGRARSALSGARSAIMAPFNGAGNWLRSRGAAVINGLRAGLLAPWQRVKNWVSGIASWIKAHKGPIELDARLLYPAGTALMGGLLRGLKFGFGDVGDFVYKAGSRISDVIDRIKSNTAGPVGAVGKFIGNMLSGHRPVPGSGNRHSGYPWAQWAGDFPNPAGTPVRAWRSGIVTAVNNWGYSYGKHVRLFHGMARTLYAHMSKLLVRPGQAVRAGQVIGLVGNTGNSFGNHLHFEKYGKGGVINEPIYGIGSRTGKGYLMGESGPETITPGVGGGSTVLEVHIGNQYLGRFMAQHVREHDRNARRKVTAGNNGGF